jgi:hypothetical protein
MKDIMDRPLLADLRKELGALGDDLREMAAARLELAQLELQSDLLSAKRLATAWLAAAVMAFAALPIAVVSLAGRLDGYCGIASRDWLLIFAGVLLLLAIAIGCFAWRRFRRRFVGLQETLEELQEDMLWLREKRERGDVK